MPEARTDAPNVITFPPIMPLGAIAISALLQWLYPLGILAHWPWYGVCPLAPLSFCVERR